MEIPLEDTVSIRPTDRIRLKVRNWNRKKLLSGFGHSPECLWLIVEEMQGSSVQNGGKGSWLLYNSFISLPYSLAILYPQYPYHLPASDIFRKRFIKYS